tara:strand:- start:821 stop:1051 length:231 start_codon:yes stop_codon:yes gene_type:complete
MIGLQVALNLHMTPKQFSWCSAYITSCTIDPLVKRVFVTNDDQGVYLYCHFTDGLVCSYTVDEDGYATKLKEIYDE